MFNNLEVLDSIRLNFNQFGLTIMNITLALIMFGIALDMKPESFKRIIAKPKSAITGILSQFVLMPALTFLLVLILNPTPAIAFGMILVAACPGGNLSNFFSSLSRSNVTLSVSLTAFADLGAILLTPFNFWFWGFLYIKTSPLLRPIEINPLDMFYTVVVLLGLPLFLGMLFAKKFPNIAKKVSKPMRIFSIVAFLGFIAAAFSSNFEYFLKYIPPIFVIVLIHNSLAFGTGFGFSSLMKLSKIDRRTIAIETSIQNSGLGLILIFNPSIFPPDLKMGGMAFIAAWWGIWHIISGLLISLYWRKKPIPQV